jgi:hypothetical protein
MFYRIQKVFTSLGLLMIATSAFAHAELQRATPPVGGTAAASPTEIRLQFSESIERSFSGVTLATGDGVSIPTGPSALDRVDKAVLIMKVLQALKPGAYRVTWHVVSVDSHRTQGSFSFSVGR